METLRSLLEGRLQPGVYLLRTKVDRSTLEDKLKDAGYNFYHLNGERISTEEDFFDEAQRALSFPDYFGRNWDAFDECITDFSWTPIAKGNIILFDSFENFAKSNPEQFELAYYGLRYATRAKTAPLPCFVLFRGDESFFPEQLTELLED